MKDRDWEILLEIIFNKKIDKNKYNKHDRNN